VLNENHITELLANYFINIGYEVVSKLNTKQKGIDLVIQNAHYSMYIEIKGETSSFDWTSRYGKSFDSKQINNHVGKAILATFMAMEKFGFNNCKYAIAFPDTPGHGLILKKIKVPLDRLDVKIYLVSETGVRLL